VPCTCPRLLPRAHVLRTSASSCSCLGWTHGT
jgi:hypothetical protein